MPCATRHRGRAMVWLAATLLVAGTLSVAGTACGDEAEESAADSSVSGSGVPVSGAALHAVIETNRGTIRIELFAEQVPINVANFVNLARRGFYDGLTFHRVVPRQFIQGGSPTGSSVGGPGYVVENEYVKELRHSAPGIMSMSGGRNGNGCQFFITLDARPFLDGVHTIVGRVVMGQEVVESIARGDMMKRVTIEGDPTPLLERLSTRVAEWNAILDQRAAGEHPADDR